MSDSRSKVVLVTGASKGIGAAIVASAADSGHRVVAIARDRTALESSVRTIATDRVLALTADVTKWDEMEAAVAKAVQHFGALDVAVANAGVATSASFFGSSGSTPDTWHTMVETNVLGTALTARAALPALAESGGHFVMIGSIVGKVMRPGLYSATKWAVSAMAASIRAEAVGTGVRVTIVQPGVIDTPDLRGDLKSRPKLSPETIAGTVMFAVDQPSDVDVNEIVIRPIGSPADC